MAKMFKTTFLYTVISLLSCLELSLSDTFHHQSSSSADECACSERYYVDTPSYHHVICQYINSTERVWCARDFLEGLSKDDSVLQLQFDYSNLALFREDFFSKFSITTLYFYSCNITDIPFGLINSGCAKATMLQLQENNITSIPAGGFHCPQLQYLLLNSNNISSVSPKAFQHLENLVVLDLQFNKLTSLPNYSGLKNLVELYVAENEIDFVSKDAFVGYGYMNLVYLAYNKISHIAEGTFDPLTNPYVAVGLKGNPFYCDCSLKWLQGWANDHNTDEPQCAARQQGPVKSLNFCPGPWWMFR